MYAEAGPDYVPPVKDALTPEVPGRPAVKGPKKIHQTNGNHEKVGKAL